MKSTSIGLYYNDTDTLIVRYHYNLVDGNNIIESLLSKGIN